MKLLKGFKLSQPWASEVVKGFLPYLVRGTNVNYRGRVGVIATKAIDEVWLKFADEKWVSSILETKNSGVIGSVDIVDSLKVKNGRVEKKLLKIGGKKYLEYYPIYRIPDKEFLFIWHLNKSKEWKKPIELTDNYSRNWVDLKLDDER